MLNMAILTTAMLIPRRGPTYYGYTDYGYAYYGYADYGYAYRGGARLTMALLWLD